MNERLSKNSWVMVSNKRISTRRLERLCFSVGSREFSFSSWLYSASALMFTLYCEMFSTVRQRKHWFLAEGQKEWLWLFKLMVGGEKGEKGYLLCQHHTSQFATRVKETVWKLEKYIRITECVLLPWYIVKKRIAKPFHGRVMLRCLRFCYHKGSYPAGRVAVESTLIAKSPLT